MNIDASCAGSAIALSVPAGARMANNTSAALSFTSPSGTTIADFALTRQLGYNNPVAADTHKYFLLYTLGPTHFAGAGNFADATRNALNAGKHWYGYPDNNVAIAKGTVSRASFPALAGYTGSANVLHLRVGCFNRGTPCSVAAGGGISHILHGGRRDDQRPDPADGHRRGLGPGRGRPAQRLGPRDRLGLRRRRHPQGRAGRRHEPARPGRRRRRGLRRGPHGRQPHLRLQPARALPEPQPRDACRPPRCPRARAR